MLQHYFKTEIDAPPLCWRPCRLTWAKRHQNTSLHPPLTDRTCSDWCAFVTNVEHGSAILAKETLHCFCWHPCCAVHDLTGLGPSFLLLSATQAYSRLHFSPAQCCSTKTTEEHHSFSSQPGFRCKYFTFVQLWPIWRWPADAAVLQKLNPVQSLWQRNCQTTLNEWEVGPQAKRGTSGWTPTNDLSWFFFLLLVT